MNNLYPMKFTPVFRDKIWGGQKIRTHLGLDFSPLPNCGEAWVLSGVPGSETVVSNGFLQDNNLNELLEVYMDDLVGEKVFARYREEFPLLIKFIDSNDYLSVQVHPDDNLAAKKGIGNGKTEMWYVLQADEGAKLYAGFNREVDKDSFKDLLHTGKVVDVLNTEPVSAGDAFFIPSGRIHALGPGILLAEIQQSSDTTYRVYDWDRRDDKGKSRELHTEEAIEALDFKAGTDARIRVSTKLNTTMPVVEDVHFTVNSIEFDTNVNKDFSELGSFVIYLCTDGAAGIISDAEPVTIKKGECVFIPAALERVTLHPEGKCRLMEVFI